MNNRYVKLKNGKRFAEGDFNIRSGETKKIPNNILQKYPNDFIIVSKPRVLRSIVRPSATSTTRKKVSSKKKVDIDVDDSG